LVGAAVALVGAAIVFAYLPAHGGDDVAVQTGPVPGETVDRTGSDAVGQGSAGAAGDGDGAAPAHGATAPASDLLEVERP
jgi:hypothetical protein